MKVEANFNRPYCGITQMTELFITTAMRTSDLTFIQFIHRAVNWRKPCCQTGCSKKSFLSIKYVDKDFCTSCLRLEMQ
jgi:hypothetical protein